MKYSKSDLTDILSQECEINKLLDLLSKFNPSLTHHLDDRKLIQYAGTTEFDRELYEVVLVSKLKDGTPTYILTIDNIVKNLTYTEYVLLSNYLSKCIDFNNLEFIHNNSTKSKKSWIKRLLKK